MIEATHLYKYFGRLAALEDVSFKVKEGEVVGILGPNGAGKTTLMRILAGYFPPGSGCVKIGGFDMARHTLAIQRFIGYLSESAPLYKELTVEEMLTFAARMKGLGSTRLRRSVERAIESSGITGVRRRLIGTLSKGFRQRTALASALASWPRLLILDEPTNGLDPEQTVEVRELIRNLSGERTVLLCSHYLSEVSALAGRVLILHGGHLLAEGGLEELEGRLALKQDIAAVIKGPHEKVTELLREIPGVCAVELSAGGEIADGSARSYVISTETFNDLTAEVSRRVIGAGHQLLELKRREVDLEEIYLTTVKRRAGGRISEVVR